MNILVFIVLDFPNSFLQFSFHTLTLIAKDQLIQIKNYNTITLVLCLVVQFI